MRKRGLLLRLPVLALLLAALACGESTPLLGSARSNPAPLGSRVTRREMTFTVDEVVRPVAAPHRLTEAGTEFVRVTVSVRCEKGKDESCDTGPMWDLTLVGLAGAYRASSAMGDLEPGKVSGGTTLTGSFFFEVGQNETDLVLKYEGRGRGDGWLALQ